ncbi:MAG: elongation factor P, partial [bacterium]
MVKISTNDLRSGKVVRLDDGQAYMVVEASHYKPGKGQALVRVRVKNLRTGQVFEKNLKSDEPIESAYYENKDGEYLYRAGDSYVFMDHENYEQHALPAEVVGEGRDLLKENTAIYFTVLDGEIIGVELPNFIELRIVDTPPG